MRETAMSPTKAELRRMMRARLRELGETRAPHSRAICDAVARHPAYGVASVVAVFDPLPSEPAVDRLWELTPRRFVYPRIVGESLELIEVGSVADLYQADGRKFREPRARGPEASLLHEVEVILVPGLAFTRRGARLGRGGGYYDRLLAALPARVVRLGVCFELQIVDTLPSEPHDARVTTVITEAAPDRSLKVSDR